MLKHFLLILSVVLFASSCSLITSFEKESEICDNGIDDNKDGKIDCDEEQCFLEPNCGCTTDSMLWDKPIGYCEGDAICTTDNNGTIIIDNNILPKCLDTPFDGEYYGQCAKGCPKGSICSYTAAGLMCLPVCTNTHQICPEYKITNQEGICTSEEEKIYGSCIPFEPSIPKCNPLDPQQLCQTNTQCTLLFIDKFKKDFYATCMKPGTLNIGEQCLKLNSVVDGYCKAGSMCYIKDGTCKKLCGNLNNQSITCPANQHCYFDSDFFYEESIGICVTLE